MTGPRFPLPALALAFAGLAAAQTAGPAITAISPAQAVAGSGAFPLTVNGRGFTQVSGCAAPVILWTAGQTEVPLTPTTVGANGTLAMATVPAALVAQQTAQLVFVKVRTQYMSTGLPPNY
ncbi:MAG: hypothetical protein HY822_15125, partial [Acidobacteria bacterium]|nr:hypothetical protein [Acidobacteriota bacterium]